MYNAESYEVDRYMKAVQDYQSLGTRIQASLSFLNSAQQAIVYATLVGKKRGHSGVEPPPPLFFLSHLSRVRNHATVAVGRC